MRSSRFWQTALALAMSSTSAFADIDKEALRSLVKIPYLPEPISLDVPALRAERAGEKLAQLSGELVSDRDNPRLNFRAGSLLREMGDPAARGYFMRAIRALRESAKAKPLDPEQARLLVEAAITSAEFELAAEGLRSIGPDESAKLMFQGELDIFRVWEAAGVTLRAPGGDRLTAVSLAALRRPDEAKLWKAWLDEASKNLKRSCQLSPKEPRPHRSLAVALVAAAYIESAIRWRAEQKTVVLMPAEAFSHFKEASNLAPEDVIAQWEAYESRVGMEKSKGQSTLPKDASKFVLTLLQRLKAIADSSQSDSRRAHEVASVIQAQTGDHPSALASMDAANALKPTTRVSLMKFALLLAMGRPREAADMGTSLLAEAFTPDIAVATAVAFERSGSPDRADAIVVDALIREPASPELRLARASFLLRNPTGEGLAEAGQSLSSLSQLDEGDSLLPEVRFLRAVYFGLIGDVEGSRLILDLLPKSDRTQRALKALKGV